MRIVPVIQRCARILLLGFSVSASLSVTRESDAAEIYVSVTGNATADGSVEKPYGSLPDAVAAVRALRKAGYTEPTVIVLREGRHQLDQTLVLGTDDGAPPDSKSVSLPKYGAGETPEPTYLTIAAYPGEHPVLSAGTPVTGWRRLEPAPPELPAQAAGKVWVTDLPAEIQKFSTLYDTKGRLNRARGPGFVPSKTGDRRNLHFPAGALKNWDNLADVELHVRPSRAWVINMLPLASVDFAAGVAKTGVSATYEMGALPAYLLSLMGKLIHDNPSHVFPAAIRCDDDQNGTLIYGNVLYRNAGHSAGIASKGINDIINNLMVAPLAPPGSGYISLEWVPVPGSKISRNVIISHPEGGNAVNDRPRGKDGPNRPKPPESTGNHETIF